METSSHQTQLNQLQNTHTRRKGGLLTMPFIIANEAFEKVASYGLVPNMILYLMKDYHLGVAKGTNIIFFWSAATNFMPLLGGFLSDSYLGRFSTIGFASISSFLGMFLLWLTAMIPEAKPPPCDLSSQTCKSPSPSQMTLWIFSFILISIGSGGIRPCSLAFGADQLDNKHNPKNQRVLESFFGWYFASASVSVLVAFTGIVYIQDHLGWRVGFGVPAILMILATILFLLASPLYVKRPANKSLLTGLPQVVVAAYRNRHLSFPTDQDSRVFYHNKKDSQLLGPTQKLQFLNKACITMNPEQDISLDGSALNPWRLCTIEQVEELKALIKVLPIWSTGIAMSINVSQGSFQLLQANSMNRHIGSSFQIPAGSFGMFTIIALALWVVLYDRVILPLASKVRGKPVRLAVKLRLGMGLLVSCTAMVISAIVESVRRSKAIHEGLADNAQAVVDMSAMWLVPQYLLHGLAEALTGIGQTEFFYSEFPKSLSSIAGALFGLGMAVANLLASVILSTVDDVSSNGGKESWVSDNINKGHYDFYYWVLALLSFINVLYFLLCSWAYGPSVDELRNIRVADNGLMKEEAELCDVSKGLEETDEDHKDNI